MQEEMTTVGGFLAKVGQEELMGEMELGSGYECS